METNEERPSDLARTPEELSLERTEKTASDDITSEKKALTSAPPLPESLMSPRPEELHPPTPEAPSTAVSSAPQIAHTSQELGPIENAAKRGEIPAIATLAAEVGIKLPDDSHQTVSAERSSTPKPPPPPPEDKTVKTSFS